MKKIVIVGGGTAGWMTAAALSHRFKNNKFTKITLIESDSIGTVGVGEATVPAIREFLKKLGINEADFIKRTNATFKLAIEFKGWKQYGESFFHPFADHGLSISGVPFMSAWTKLHQNGDGIPIDHFNLGSHLAAQGRFAIPTQNDEKGNSLYNYAFHFDAGLAAQYFRTLSEMAGVRRREGEVTDVQQCPRSGDVEQLTLRDGSKVEGDFFIDCSGFKGLLIKEAMGVGFDDWTRYLPCDRAVTVGSNPLKTFPSSTRALAKAGGWQWRIPLQNRVGNGFVYSSDHISDERALLSLQSELPSAQNSEPKFLKFTTGMRLKTWEKNVYAIGLSAGFLEPLESTGIYLIQIGISLLLSNFPIIVRNEALIDEINRGQREHWLRVRDFIILHYALNGREGEPLWDHCRHMELPTDLSDNIALYKATGRLRLQHADFFQRSSWVSMLTGLGVVPERYHPKVDDFPYVGLVKELKAMSGSMYDAASGAPRHRDFILKNCASNDFVI